MEITAQFLRQLIENAENNPSLMIPYTREMSDRAKKLVEGVEVDDDLIEIVEVVDSP